MCCLVHRMISILYCKITIFVALQNLLKGKHFSNVNGLLSCQLNSQFLLRPLSYAIEETSLDEKMTSSKLVPSKRETPR